MPNIGHRFGIRRATAAELYAAVSTIEGFKKWWTVHCDGDAALNGTVSFRFPNSGPEFRMHEMVPPSHVSMICTGGPADWIGTRLEFSIEPDGDEIALDFRHAGWRDETPLMRHCSAQWAYFLFGLKSHFETGKGAAFGSPDYRPLGRQSPS